MANAQTQLDAYLAGLPVPTVQDYLERLTKPYTDDLRVLQAEIRGARASHFVATRLTDQVIDPEDPTRLFSANPGDTATLRDYIEQRQGSGRLSPPAMIQRAVMA